MDAGLRVIGFRVRVSGFGAGGVRVWGAGLCFLMGTFKRESPRLLETLMQENCKVHILRLWEAPGKYLNQ